MARRLEADDDAMATCRACGAETFDLTEIGEVHSAGREVEQRRIWRGRYAPPQ
jgi:hypothetical protein